MPTLPPSPSSLARAASILRAGGLVAFPTETVYGLGANALDEGAVRRIFAAKGRPGYNPLIVHVPGAEGARALVASWPELAERAAAAFWPGPLTLVLPKRPVVPDLVTAGLPAVAVRAPSHPVALALLEAAGLPLAAPSANRFTELSPTSARHVERALGDRVDLILDGGPTQVGIESTVLDLTGPRPALLRPGVLSAPELEAVLGPLEPHHAARTAPADDPTPRRSPGMVDRHYAPRARLRLFAADERDEARRAAAAEDAAGGAAGALLLASADPLPAPPLAHVVAMPADPAAYASRLYAELHALDDAGCTLVLVERVPEGEAWAGVRDRLERASR